MSRVIRSRFEHHAVVIVIRAVAALIGGRLEFLLTSPWTLSAVALLTLSSATMVVIGARGLAEHQERYDLELQQRLKATFQPVGPSGRQVERALRVVRPPTIASLLVPGQEGRLPAAWDVGPATAEALASYPATRLSTGTGGVADMSAFVGQFAGLLALVLGLMSVLRDRGRGWADAERGTTAPPFVFVSANLIAGCLALAVIVSIWFGLVGFTINQVLDSSWLEANQTVWMLAPLTWLYTVTLYGYGAAIAWYARKQLRAVAYGVALWVCLALLSPLLVLSWSGDLPSRALAEQEQRETYTDRVRQLEVEVGRQIETRVVGVLLASERDRQITAEFQALEPFWVRGMAEARAAADSLEEAWRTESNHVATRIQQAARLTPSTLLPQLLAEVSGTGNLTRTRWQEAVGDYKRRLDGALFDDRSTVILRLKLDGSGEVWMHERHPVVPFRDLPQFSEPTITTWERWQASANDVVVLVLHVLFALTMAGIAQRRAWRRYDFASLSAPDIGRP